MTRPEPPAAWADLAFFRGPAWPALWDRLAADAARRPFQPPAPALFRALELTPPGAVRAVILGQDPYHREGRATGLAFGYPPGVRPDHSLRAILGELREDLGIVRADGDLSGWACQGVLLLNTVLSVPAGAGMAGAHADLGWQALTAEVLARVARRPTAFLLWGRAAQRAAAPHLAPPQGGGAHLVIAAPHPSPRTAGFRGHRPFSRVNAWLAARGEPPIDWSR